LEEGGEIMKSTLYAIISLITLAFALIIGPKTALANPALITIATPTDGAEFEVGTLPTTILFSGTITHSPSNVNDMQPCLNVDSSTVCGNLISGVGNLQSYPYAIPVEFDTPGEHTIQAYTDKTGGGHYGSSAPINITIFLVPVACDEVDPPGYANEYLNSLNLPQEYATKRGQIISAIANYMNDGRYGTCNYNYELVKYDVDLKLAELGY
jgi:hypothetical protein